MRVIIYVFCYVDCEINKKLPNLKICIVILDEGEGPDTEETDR